MDDLYRDIILDHYRNPRNVGWIESCKADEQLFFLKAANASCGDEIEASIVVNGGKVIDIKWRGTGCAISQASMSMVSEWGIGKTLDEIKSLSQKQVLEMMGMDEITPTREKCLVLSLQLFQDLH
jgi:nitrogen fixation protein NifU and related proteins